jgi:RNA polymerase sigma factor (sigma-70 family)
MTEDAAVPQQRAASVDEQALLQRLRAGEDKAFSELFEVHAAAVRRLSRSLASDRSEAEDITAETFFRVLQALRRGAGPKDHVRAYLLTVARRVSWEWHGARRDVPVTDDELTSRAGAGVDAHAGTAERNLIATAFTSLPERWRAVLWQTEVEGEQPAVVAPHFGLSANATAALARRARQGLRAAYLQAHLAVNRISDVGCRGVIEKLGGYTAGSVTGSEARRIRAHLLSCASCRAMHAELREVCSSLRAHAGVLAMLVPATAAASGSGLLSALKGVLVSKLKVGIALVSTAAAGVVGFTVGPAMVDSTLSQSIGLPGGGVDLQISAQPFPSPGGSAVSSSQPAEATVVPGQPEEFSDAGDAGTSSDSVAAPPATVASSRNPASTPDREGESRGGGGNQGEDRSDTGPDVSGSYAPDAPPAKPHAPVWCDDPGHGGWQCWWWWKTVGDHGNPDNDHGDNPGNRPGNNPGNGPGNGHGNPGNDHNPGNGHGNPGNGNSGRPGGPGRR